MARSHRNVKTNDRLVVDGVTIEVLAGRARLQIRSRSKIEAKPQRKPKRINKST